MVLSTYARADLLRLLGYGARPYPAAVTFSGSEQPVQGFVRGLSEGQPIDLPGWSMRVKVTAGDTLGRFTVLHGEMAPELAGPPAHVHAEHDETFVVLTGRMRFRVGDRFLTAMPGETVYASRRLAHGFANPYDEPARYAAILSPSGYEEYFRQVAEHVARVGTLPGAAVTAELMARHATTLADPRADRAPGSAT